MTLQIILLYRDFTMMGTLVWKSELTDFTNPYVLLEDRS